MPETRPVLAPDSVNTLLGSRAYGIYVDGAKHGWETIKVDRASSSGGDRLVVTTSGYRCDDENSLLPLGEWKNESSFETVSPHRLRSALLEPSRDGEFSFVQGPIGARLRIRGMGKFGARLETRGDTVVENVLSDAIPDRWLLLTDARVGSVIEFRPFHVLMLVGSETAKRETGPANTLRPELRKARVTAVDGSSTRARYRMDVEVDGGIEHRVYDAEGWMSRSTALIDGRFEEWVAETPENVRLPFDAQGRYRAGWWFRSAADGPDLVEALSIELPAAMEPSIDRVGVLSVDSRPISVIVALAPGERAATDADRTGWGGGTEPSLTPEDRAWATRVAGARGSTREKLGRLRDAVNALVELPALERAARLSLGARAIGIPARVVEGHAITDRSGLLMAPHAWIEAIDGDIVVTVDPASSRIPAPPTRLPTRPPSDEKRGNLTKLGIDIAVASSKLRDVGVPDLKRLAPLPRRPRHFRSILVDSLAKEMASLPLMTPRGSAGTPDEIDLPERLPPGSEALYRTLPEHAEALRHVVARDRWHRSDLETLRVVAEALKRLPDPPDVEVSTERAEDARAGARALGSWMEHQIRKREVYAGMLPVLPALGPYIGLTAPTDVTLIDSTKSCKLAGLDVSVGVAEIHGARHTVVQAKRDGTPVWSRVICGPGRMPVGKPRWSAVPLADLGSFGYRLQVRAATGAHIYLSSEGSFQFYLLNPFR